MRAVAIGFAISISALASAFAQAPETPEPFQLIRSLQVIQSQIATGSQAAYLAQPKLMTQIADDFARVPMSIWRETRNAEAAAIYLFSGGLAKVVRPLLQSGAIPEAQRALVTGALSYMEGREQDAYALLMKIDARSVSPTLGGHLALAQAALIGAKDPAAASGFLDTARLLMPGSLVEEAALRRQIFMTDAKVDLDKFFLMARQYFQRYRNSVYASQYWPRFASLLSNSAFATKDGDFDKIEAFLVDFTTKEQRDLYLSIARSAIRHGSAQAMQRAAKNARRLSETGSAEALRAELYESAAMIASNQVAAGLEKLTALPSERFSIEERELAIAAKALAANMRAPAKPVPTADDATAKPAVDKADVEMPRGFAVAQQAISEADKLLNGKAQK